MFNSRSLDEGLPSLDRAHGMHIGEITFNISPDHLSGCSVGPTEETFQTP